MAENVDRHRNSVMNLEYTFSQRLGKKWQIFRPHEDTRVTWWLGDNPFSHLPTACVSKVLEGVPPDEQSIECGMATVDFERQRTPPASTSKEPVLLLADDVKMPAIIDPSPKKQQLNPPVSHSPKQKKNRK
ncbi:uncharacterized protein LOC124311775 [Daphnia pulicaria]|uniref:uncharacterized protein LOC124311775 n=1 Tax=Daphnia pulicaria TaxID=35523 RepID=UPI001EEAB273|nr:uncharacterized protein LOC124311775 [Daphnia pulicaria]